MGGVGEAPAQAGRPLWAWERQIPCGQPVIFNPEGAESEVVLLMQSASRSMTSGLVANP
ncbi:hypothetical protein AZA_74205 [Nitrospirillum viridazoti Y2]|nr:hypothetical protein AZA_74205 [Nitrospirillum amazonense Y2]